jgi:hypothetical protein
MDRGHRLRGGKNLRSSEMGPVAGSCEYSNNPSGFIKVGGFLDKLGNLSLLTKASAFTPPQATTTCGGRIFLRRQFPNTMSRWDVATWIRTHVPAGIKWSGGADTVDSRVINRSTAYIYEPRSTKMYFVHLRRPQADLATCWSLQVAHHARSPFTFREISSFLLSEYDALVQTV